MFFGQVFSFGFCLGILISFHMPGCMKPDGKVLLARLLSDWHILFSLFYKHPSVGKSFFADFWFGRVKDSQLKDGFIDAKLWFYLIGAVMLQLNVLSFAAYHIMNVENINYGFLLGCAMLTWFCFDYLIFEKIHLWTYDFIAERVGFKLGFGCLAFYPFFYSISLWFTAHLPNPGHPVWLTILFACTLPLRLGVYTRRKYAEVFL